MIVRGNAFKRSRKNSNFRVQRNTQITQATALNDISQHQLTKYESVLISI